MINFFYGMSGAFKGVTISAVKNASEKEIVEVRSMIKYWKDSSLRIFSTSFQEDHRNYTLLHLCNLKHTVENIGEDSEVVIERGVTDSLYYWLRGKIYGREIEDEIARAVEEELRIASGVGEIKKILLVNKDSEFIKNVILKEPHRAQVFPGGLPDYLEQQEKYIAFTSRWNKIDEVRVIENARDYIEGLGLKYIEN